MKTIKVKKKCKLLEKKFFFVEDCFNKAIIIGRIQSNKICRQWEWWGKFKWPVDLIHMMAEEIAPCEYNLEKKIKI